MARLRAKTLITLSCVGVTLGGCVVDDPGGGEEGEASQRAPQAREGEPAPPAREPGDADECTSTMTEYGLVCTTCPGDSGPPECLVGDCMIRNRCLECTDPRGRVGVDCSIDYEDFPTASAGSGGGDTFHSRSASWGFPVGSSSICHYPGTDSCVYSEEGDARCIDCTYPDGSGSGRCLLDASDELPDPFAGRPSILPEPGECRTETSEDGQIQCSTCTREDLSAAKICRFPPAVACGTARGENPLEGCLVCILDNNGVVEICDDGGT
jgi:hypothetical protein